MKKIDISYMGFSSEIIYELLNSKLYELKAVAIEKNRLLSKDIINLLNKKKIPVYTINSKKDLCNLKQWFTCDTILIYKFGLILPNAIVDQFKVFNIHPGDLKTNRGAHPISWTILLDEVETCLSLYKLYRGIDLGLLIKKFVVYVDRNDDTICIEKRLNSGLKEIIESLYQYLEGKIDGEWINRGDYRRKVNEDDYTIKIEIDTFDDIDCKIRSQKAYKGAVLNIDGFKLYVNGIERK